MNELQKEALEEMKTAIYRWFKEQGNRVDIEGLGKRTPLQIGIFNFLIGIASVSFLGGE